MAVCRKVQLSRNSIELLPKKTIEKQNKIIFINCNKTNLTDSVEYFAQLIYFLDRKPNVFGLKSYCQSKSLRIYSTVCILSSPQLNIKTNDYLVRDQGHVV